MKIVILDGYTTNPGDLSWDALAALGELVVYDRTPVELAAQRMTGFDAVYTNKVPMTAELMDKCPHLKFIGVLATGYNIIDTAAARARGITVCNVPAYSTLSVAQITFALILELTNAVGVHSAAVKAGEWQKIKDFCFWITPVTELAEKTIGLLGYGAIGKAVAAAARAFGMKVLFNTPSMREGAVSLDELLEKSDIVSLHCPLTPENKKMFNAEKFAKMKKGAFFINTARGGLVDEEALADALNSGHLGGAGLDVMDSEPPKAGNPLLSAKNIVITPHIGWASKEARQRLIDVSVNNLKAFLSGQPINRV
ncbi:MAG: D-2-hydroxyacid dehydrogenase [Christensenellales bacterium]|jgi:glycerate dehydrogenase|nr:D-2-hydroxyacid dehydrogenase [Eubacteriales bacterium]